MLMEVLIAIAVVGLMITPIFVMQSGSLRGISRYSDKIRLLFSAKNVAVKVVVKLEEEKEEELSGTEQINRPSATLTYSVGDIKKGSSLEEVKDMHKIQVATQTRRAGKESVVAFVYMPEREKK